MVSGSSIGVLQFQSDLASRRQTQTSQPQEEETTTQTSAMSAVPETASFLQKQNKARPIRADYYAEGDRIAQERFDARVQELIARGERFSSSKLLRQFQRSEREKAQDKYVSDLDRYNGQRPFTKEIEQKEIDKEIQRLINDSDNQGKVTVEEVKSNPALVSQLQNKVGGVYSDLNSEANVSRRQQEISQGTRARTYGGLSRQEQNVLSNLNINSRTYSQLSPQEQQNVLSSANAIQGQTVERRRENIISRAVDEYQRKKFDEVSGMVNKAQEGAFAARDRVDRLQKAKAERYGQELYDSLIDKQEVAKLSPFARTLEVTERKLDKPFPLPSNAIEVPMYVIRGSALGVGKSGVETARGVFGIASNPGRTGSSVVKFVRNTDQNFKGFVNKTNDGLNKGIYPGEKLVGSIYKTGKYFKDNPEQIKPSLIIGATVLAGKFTKDPLDKAISVGTFAAETVVLGGVFGGLGRSVFSRSTGLLFEVERVNRYKKLVDITRVYNKAEKFALKEAKDVFAATERIPGSNIVDTVLVREGKRGQSTLFGDIKPISEINKIRARAGLVDNEIQKIRRDAKFDDNQFKTLLGSLERREIKSSKSSLPQTRTFENLKRGPDTEIVEYGADGKAKFSIAEGKVYSGDKQTGVPRFSAFSGERLYVEDVEFNGQQRLFTARARSPFVELRQPKFVTPTRKEFQSKLSDFGVTLPRPKNKLLLGFEEKGLILKPSDSAPRYFRPESAEEFGKAASSLIEQRSKGTVLLLEQKPEVINVFEDVVVPRTDYEPLRGLKPRGQTVETVVSQPIRKGKMFEFPRASSKTGIFSETIIDGRTKDIGRNREGLFRIVDKDLGSELSKAGKLSDFKYNIRSESRANGKFNQRSRAESVVGVREEFFPIRETVLNRRLQLKDNVKFDTRSRSDTRSKTRLIPLMRQGSTSNTFTREGKGQEESKPRLKFFNGKGDGFNSKAYETDVKVKRSWVRVSKQPLTRDSALSLGQDIVDNSAARSFRVRQVMGKPTSTGFGKMFDSSKFTRKRSGVYVERSKFAIDTEGEVQGITAKGLLAQRNRKMFSFGRFR